VFYYTISEGKHPFGNTYSCQDNILRGQYNLEHLTSIRKLSFHKIHILLLSEDYIALNAIEKMIEQEPTKRPPMHAVASHPIFWSKERQLSFFMEVSDRIEKEPNESMILQVLERNNASIVTSNWMNKLTKPLQEGKTSFN
jgi:serine/threonine-protein kinase/endoribonuclease IRE1